MGSWFPRRKVGCSPTRGFECASARSSLGEVAGPIAQALDACFGVRGVNPEAVGDDLA
jgi:hypothetical protein